ncbi:DUF6262 family protein [uncultured Clostridium sp.]|uniref:DUF6262 family protein n=1 Tax=uncultured Clostridium sp. TaxID=59620 RepID=UPI0028EBD7B4|nr:DUF6262 family protein [uncultured Clostridium sp.]
MKVQLSERILKVDDAVRRLIKSESAINFNIVAKESGVTKAYLYKNEEIKEHFSCVAAFIFLYKNKSCKISDRAVLQDG